MPDYHQLGIVAVLEGSLRSNAHRTALIVGDEHWTYRRLDEESAQFANALSARSVKRGDRALLVLANTPEYVVAFVGCLRSGVLPVPVNQMLSATDVAKIARHADPAIIVVDGGQLPQIEGVPGRRLVSHPTEGVGLTAQDEDLADAMTEQERSFASPVVSADEPVVLLYTGGTTGDPKAVVHTGMSLGMNAWAQLLEADISRDERLVLSTPLSHAAGFFLLPALCRGAAGIILTRFDPDVVASAVREQGGTWTYMVPTMLYRWLDAGIPERHDLAGLRTIVYGAAPVMGARLADAVRRMGPVFIQQYGQTEVPTFATVLTKADHQAAFETGNPTDFESAGYACVMCEIAIVDDSGERVPAGEHGEVIVRSPYNMAGYLGAPETTAASFYGEWLRTGDVGMVDVDGRLFLLDRLKDVVITGGMNVYTREVEEEIQKFDCVREVAAFGIPDEKWGERLEVAVTLREDLEPEALREMFAAPLSAYKRPKAVHVMDTIPTTPFGKFDKKALRRTFGADSDAHPSAVTTLK